MKNTHLFDIIETDKYVKVGIIDFVSTKHVSFIDFTNNQDPRCIKIVLLWRTYYSHLLFSAFKSMFFTDVPIGESIQISKKIIKSPAKLVNTKPVRKITRIQVTATE